MIPFRSLAASIALALIAFGTAHADACRLVRLASFDFTGQDSIIISASIEGKNANMLVDTGAPLSTIDPGLVQNLHLSEKRLEKSDFEDIGGRSLRYLAYADDLRIGNAHASNVSLLVWPSAFSKSGQLSGTIAADLLRHYDVDIDFEAHKISLFSQDHCPGKVVFWTSGPVAVVSMHVSDSGHIIVPVKLDGRDFEALLDTGATSSVLFQDAASADFALLPNSPGMTRITEDDGPQGKPVYRHTFATLELEGLSIAKPAFEIFEGAQKRSMWHEDDAERGITDMIVGLNELRHLHLYIAYGEEKLYLSAAAGSATTATAAVAATKH